MTTVGVISAEFQDWRRHAACRGADPEIFFPVGASGAALRQIETAKAVCQGCPVRAACLVWATAHGIDAGVWGGTTEGERRALAWSRQRVPRRTTHRRIDPVGTHRRRGR